MQGQTLFLVCFITETEAYFKEANARVTTFNQYFKGRSELGSIVESCVKLTKRLIYGAIKKTVLPLRQFEFIIAQTVSLVNKRPVALKEYLRSNESIPEAITPEMLVHGHSLLSANIVPHLQPVPDDPDWSSATDPAAAIHDMYQKLRKVREELIKIYNEEFVSKLIEQATNSKSRYKPVTHNTLQVDDLVVIKEEHTKPANYPMARVKSLEVNEQGEITGAVLIKGATNETVKRHSSTLIPILRRDPSYAEGTKLINNSVEQGGVGQSTSIRTNLEGASAAPVRPKYNRVAAQRSKDVTRQMLHM